MSHPPAHRRLVPRVPKPDAEPTARDAAPEVHEAHESLTAVHAKPGAEPTVVDVFDPSILDLDDTVPPTGPRDSMVVTAQRPRLDPADLEVTAPRAPAPATLPPDEEFTGETLARAPRLPSEGEAEPPAPPPMPSAVAAVVASSAAASFADLEPTTLHAPSTSGIEDRPTAHLTHAELGLVAAIAEGHEPSRLLYADWLERRGESARAEYLRLDHAVHAMNPADPRFTRMYLRMRELAPRISVDWRSRVSRASIEACSAYGVTCPGTWRALPAERDDVRACNACHEPVYYCTTLPIAQEHVQRGSRVALDATCVRWPNDLDRQCTGCGRHVPPQTRFCPHCGGAMGY